MKFRNVVLGFFSLFMLAACEEDIEEIIVDDDTEISSINQFVYDFMRDNYLWNDHMPSSPKLTYSDPADLVDELIYAEKDRWTYIMKDPTASSNGRTSEEDLPVDIGTGVYPAVVNGQDGYEYFIVQVSQDCDAYKAGVRRGDRILKVNNSTPNENNVFELYTGEIGVSFSLELESLSGEIFTANFSSEIMDIPYVGETKIKELSNNKKVGYIYYETFEKNSEEPLNEAFQMFKDENVTDLIIDLRYNGGGYLDICQQIGSLCYDRGTESDIFLKLLYNDDINYEDVITFDSNLAASLDINSIIFITTQNSASASEALINGLEPYVNEVKVIGDQSHGKYVGSVVLNEEDYFFFPITFKVANTNNVTDYENGLSVDYKVTDYVNVALTDETVGQYAEALYYLETGTWGKPEEDQPVARKASMKVVSDLKIPTHKQQLLK